MYVLCACILCVLPAELINNHYEEFSNVLLIQADYCPSCYPNTSYLVYVGLPCIHPVLEHIHVSNWQNPSCTYFVYVGLACMHSVLVYMHAHMHVSNCIPLMT